MTDLDYLILLVNRMKKRCNYTHLIHYDYSCGFAYDEDGEKRLQKPSYNVCLWYGDLLVAEVCFVLNENFSLNVSEERSTKIEEALDETLIGLIGASGITPLINSRITKKKVSYINIYESEKSWKISMN